MKKALILLTLLFFSFNIASQNKPMGVSYNKRPPASGQRTPEKKLGNAHKNKPQRPPRPGKPDPNRPDPNKPAPGMQNPPPISPDEPSIFRGLRRGAEAGPVILEKSIFKKEKNGQSYIELIFSTSIDPRSLNSSTVSINGQPLDENYQIMFNREGTLCRIYINDLQFPAELNLFEIKSYYGEIIPPVKTVIDSGS